MALLGDLEVSLLHVRGLLGVERIRYGPQDKDVQLDALFALFLFALMFLLDKRKKEKVLWLFYG